MKAMVVGGGGREHAIAWKIARSPDVTAILCAPGNAGTGREAKCRNIATSSIGDLVATAVGEKVDIVMIGPEQPLVDGLADRLREAGVSAIGPGAEAAMLEGSKVFSKLFMEKYGVKTPSFHVFDDSRAATSFARSADYPLVIKADGLAAGKGVAVCRDLGEARGTIRDFMEKDTLHGAGKAVLIEEFLEGVEASIIAAADGRVIKPFLSCRDHKQVFDGNRGPNTGGMGAIAPNPAFGADEEVAFLRDVLEPSLRGMHAEGLAYKGFLFFGLMMTTQGVYNLEYNVRLGDPETEALLPLMKSDFAVLLGAMGEGRLADLPLEWQPGSSCTLIAASKGYPGDYESGHTIHGYGLTDSKVFLAGAREEADSLVTSGGRVLALTAVGKDLATARAAAYRDMEKIRFEGMHFRTDIGE